MEQLVLASGSAARATMLRNAGLDFDIHPPETDESLIKQRMLTAGASADQIAQALAEAKALAASRSRPGAYVIGADQILVHDGVMFDKPATLSEAADHLRTLRGSSHHLISAVCVARDEAPVWSTTSLAQLRMRAFSDPFLSDYLDRFGAAAMTSVGAYHLEGLGSQLFEQIDGDYFTILGLPLLELLAFLRTKGMLPE